MWVRGEPLVRFSLCFAPPPPFFLMHRDITVHKTPHRPVSGLVEIWAPVLFGMVGPGDCIAIYMPNIFGTSTDTNMDSLFVIFMFINRSSSVYLHGMSYGGKVLWTCLATGCIGYTPLRMNWLQVWDPRSVCVCTCLHGLMQSGRLEISLLWPVSHFTFSFKLLVTWMETDACPISPPLDGSITKLWMTFLS